MVTWSLEVFSVAFTAGWQALNSYSRIIDFGNGQEDSNIFIANAGKDKLAFHVFAGKEERRVVSGSVIHCNEEHRYLCTLSSDGCMRIYQDGELIGESGKGNLPSPGQRTKLYVAKSNWKRDPPFGGWISELRVWNAVVDAQESGEGVEDQTSDPEERLRKLSAELPPSYVRLKTEVRDLVAELAGSESELNPSQQTAVSTALTRRLSLIQGPPGTGKTHVSCRLLEMWVKLGIRPILASSDSNIAVDNLAEGAQSRGLNVVRVGRPEKVTPQMESLMLESRMRRAQQAMQGFLDGSVDDSVMDDDEQPAEAAAAAGQLAGANAALDAWSAKMHIMKTADVICCTTVAAGSSFFQSLKFGAIIIDEAAQATELSALVPVVLQGTEQLVLVGDHCQLPPSIACFEAEVRGLSLSLFGRLAAQGLAPFFLDTQFRMHPMIAAFSSAEFYGGKLKTGIAAANRPAPTGFEWPQSNTGIAFVNVQGDGEDSDSQSKSNATEVEKVLEIILDVLMAGELSCTDIGVVSPYKAQVKELRQNLRQQLPGFLGAANVNAATIKDLEIASVDAFQGREKELIIFSAVRSNPHGNVGFLADWRRLNVMITRARRGLIIIGDLDTLKCDKTWSKWLKWAQLQHVLVNSEGEHIEMNIGPGKGKPNGAFSAKGANIPRSANIPKTAPKAGSISATSQGQMSSACGKGDWSGPYGKGDWSSGPCRKGEMMMQFMGKALFEKGFGKGSWNGPGW